MGKSFSVGETMALVACTCRLESKLNTHNLSLKDLRASVSEIKNTAVLRSAWCHAACSNLKTKDRDCG